MCARSSLATGFNDSIGTVATPKSHIPLHAYLPILAILDAEGLGKHATPLHRLGQPTMTR